MSYYNILNVSPNASVEDIKKAYKRLLIVTHPDKNIGRETEFIAIKKAWEILSNPEHRKIYDAKLEFQALQTFAISDKIFFKEFEVDEAGNYTFSCRCQNDYVITQEDADYLVKYVSCCGCSSTIEIIYYNYSQQNYA